MLGRVRGGLQGPLLAPLLAFVAALAVASAVAATHDRPPLDAASWASWDSPIYLDIAENGYSTRPCTDFELSRGAEVCGNAGWFPLYPALVAGVAAFGVDLATAGILVSLACWLALLVLLWNGLLRRAGGRAALPVLALAAFAPGSQYFHSIYPMSVTVLLLVLGVIALDRHRWVLAGLAGGLAATAYPAAGVYAGIAGLWLLLVAPAPGWGERVRRTAIVGGLTVAGTVAVFLYMQAAIGQWDAYFGVQAQYQHGFHGPWTNWLDLMKPRFEGLSNVSLFIAFQGLLTTVLVVLVVLGVWRRRHDDGPLGPLLAIWALAFWVLPLTQATTAYYRTDTLLLPMVVALVRYPPPLVAALAAVGAVVSAGMTLAYLQGVLV